MPAVIATPMKQVENHLGGGGGVNNDSILQPGQ